MCSSTSDSWCKHPAGMINGTNSYKESIDLPTSVKKKIYPTFMDLSNGNPLQICLPCKTQNKYGSINGVIWKCCPKEIFSGRLTLETSNALVVACYNDEACGISPICRKLGLESGKVINKFCIKKDSDRKKIMVKKLSDLVKRPEEKT